MCVHYLKALHILEKHCPQWLDNYSIGMAFHGEQGGEMLHSTISKVEKRAAGMRKETERIRFLMESSIVQTSTILSNPPHQK